MGALGFDCPRCPGWRGPLLKPEAPRGSSGLAAQMTALVAAMLFSTNARVCVKMELPNFHLLLTLVFLTRHCIFILI